MALNDYTGQVLDGKYNILELLGRGGMGSVYRGQHIVIGKTVAVKFLHAEFAGNKEVVQRFYREAQAAAAVGHEGIIDVMDVGLSTGGEPYLVMEYLEGESLANLLRRKSVLDVAAACGVMEPVLRALNAAHRKGIIHRDLKPENIFLATRSEGAPRIKLIDFGISKFADSTTESGAKLTNPGSLMGTPAYMSPEQARASSELDYRADLYSAGVILYEMVTGGLPFAGSNFTESIVNILTADPMPPRELRPDLPAEVEPILLRSLVKDPGGRYQTALDFLATLRSLPGFPEREARLTVYASSLDRPSFAAGDLGEDFPDGASVAAEVLSEVISESEYTPTDYTPTEYTPTGWTGTELEREGRRSKAPLIVVLLATLLVGGGLAYWYWGIRQHSPVPVASVPIVPTVPAGLDEPTPPPPAPPSVQEQSVEISIPGLPESALVRYNEQLMADNPFRVPRGEAVVPLRIEAEGYEQLVVTLVPAKDQVVAVSLQKLALREEPAPTEKDAKLKEEKTEQVVESERVRSRRQRAARPRPEPKVEEAPEPEPQKVVLPKPAAEETTAFKGVVLPDPPAPPEEKAPEPVKPKSTTKKGARGTKIQTTFE